MEITFETFETDYCNLVISADRLCLDLLRKGKYSEGFIIKKLYSRMELIHCKAAAVDEFIKIFRAAEEKNTDLGDERNCSASLFLANLITDFSIEIESGPIYLTDSRSRDLIGKWESLCSSYKKYFTEISLPKGIDLDMYKFAVKLSEE